MNNKFRAWDKKHSIWAPSGFFALADNGDVLILDAVENHWLRYLHQDILIELYIRLKDINEVDIYDGDIIKTKMVDGFFGYPVEMIGLVEYDYGRWVIKYHLDDGLGDRFFPIDTLYYEREPHYVPNVGDVFDRTESPRSDLEIIGNVHENAGLLT